MLTQIRERVRVSPVSSWILGWERVSLSKDGDRQVVDDAGTETVANREDVVRSRLDPGEAQAFALADTHDGRLLTDDGDSARSTAPGTVARGLSVNSASTDRG